MSFAIRQPIRIFKSALQNVKYIPGGPMPFTTDRKLLDDYHATADEMRANQR